MDKWKFYDITHREHIICNPLSMEKIGELVGLLRLNPGDRMLELAMGKGEFIIQLAESYGIAGIGVDLSPYHLADARRRLRKRMPDAQIEFIEMDGADYQPPALHSFALAACIGASWIFDGHQGTLEALSRMVAPGGWVVVGEPYWLQTPPQAYLDAIGWQAGDYATHYENMQIGETLGLKLAYTIVSSHDDWDRYEGLQWYAAENYARANPQDPDVPELLRDVQQNKEAYLKWGRNTLGWAIYAFRTPA